METEHEDFLALIKHIPGMNPETAIENIGGSARLFKKLLKKVGGLLRTNIEAMETALSENSLEAFGIKAHGMKGSFNQAGCFELARLAGHLERAAKNGDAAYVAVHFSEYREQVLLFHERLCEALHEAGDDTAETPKGLMTDYFDALTEAKAAASGYDSVSAAECLAPLTKFRFGENTDRLLLRALEELEAFRPKKAEPLIAELLEQCVKQKQKE